MSFQDINTKDIKSRVFKGFVQFQDPGAGTTTWRLKERQQMSITYRFIRETHYNDAGEKGIDPAGYDHTFNLTVKLTPDLFDDVEPPTDTNTISYWIDQNMPPTNNPIEIVFLATAEALKGPPLDLTKKFIHQVFTLVPHTFGPITWNPNGGTNEISISGEILTISKISREASVST